MIYLEGHVTEEFCRWAKEWKRNCKNWIERDSNKAI